MTLDQATLETLRGDFETRWIPSNGLRTVCALLTTAPLLAPLIGGEEAIGAGRGHLRRVS